MLSLLFKENERCFHLVERHRAKVEVAGSSPVIRSIKSVQLMYWFFYFTDFFAKQGARRGGYYPPASKHTNFVINRII